MKRVFQKQDLATMPIDFYYAPHSPACRSVLMLAEALNLELNLKLTNTSEKAHLTPEFIKINPQHTIPTIVDDGFSIWESRAILTYLVNKYAKGSALYPEEPKARAVVDQRLYFDLGVLYQRFFDYMFPQLAGVAADEAKLQKVEEALGFLETFLEGNQFVAGHNMTIADISIAAELVNFRVVNIDIFKYPNIKAWYNRMKTTAPGFSKTEEAVALFEKLIAERREQYKKE